MGKRYEIKSFITVRQPDEIIKKDNKTKIMVDGNVVYTNKVIPVIVEGLGCIATVKVDETNHLGNKTEVIFRVIENLQTGDLDKFDVYYRAYNYLKEDDKIV